MAEKKVQIEVNSLDNFASAFQKMIQDSLTKGMSEAAKKSDSSGLKKKVDEAFSMDKAKQNVKESLQSIVPGTAEHRHLCRVLASLTSTA